MNFNKIMRIAEDPPRADYSLSPGEGAAVAAIIPSFPVPLLPVPRTG
ncbi:MAG: hypothetical protein ACJ788_04995 [Ktedonobacteraceae bacterium]